MFLKIFDSFVWNFVGIVRSELELIKSGLSFKNSMTQVSFAVDSRYLKN
ncbi:hypothetical protein LEP1GSC172_3528 [Leptospira noguchii]|uniref:Uncharacterized protein n=2 Tax=Leptospira noguchii TaxID=28182 RepID=T0GR47_9LEPT|nr:hypothetical protein LEP1GSC172_3528 [Leptospira noguchii]EQA71397.1 hypothetical protein LEP1GSC059_2773 [Leptospira noguchii serovar Panama str. CZ214]